MVRLEVVAVGALILFLEVLLANNIVSAIICACVPAITSMSSQSRCDSEMLSDW